MARRGPIGAEARRKLRAADRRRLLLSLPLLSLLACAGILGIKPPTARRFEHRAHVLKGIACVQCHNHVQQSTEDSPLDLPDTASCLKCHDKPHDKRECKLCHGLESTRQAVREAKAHLRFDHVRHREGIQGRCVRCHTGVAQEETPLRPAMATCLSCHQHRAQWDSRNCGACHKNMELEGSRPKSHIVHGDDFLARHGVAAAGARDLCSSCHAESMCASCHGVNVPALPSTLHFDEPARPDMHAPNFFARHGREAAADPGLCVTCHSESSCRSCHAKRGLLELRADQPAPHPPGWVGPPGSGNLHGREARRDPMRCASCHGGAGESLCVGCHRVGGPGGNPHPPGFRADKPLADMPCRMCHTGGV